MADLLTEITGSENMTSDGGALDALIGFYRAFNAGDLGALAANWADGDKPSMDNPIGGIRRGWPSIRDGYARLFDGKAKVQVRFHDFASQGGDDWHLFVGRERRDVASRRTGASSFVSARRAGSPGSTVSGASSTITAPSRNLPCLLPIRRSSSARRWIGLPR